ncbi:hypothetical protein DRH14_05100 [Candidatus Shapirobacteria bacterium]|nr:MAG: hypothetical protein DRH14_05100 [Candidatus Shapirobacteria bacterium]RLG68743.1 MAG: hypothetical protein DRO11_08670 [Euryarchaeota archaeon]
MSDVEFLRGKLERLNAEKRCWQLVKEILTFLAKAKREGERLAPVGNSPSRNSPTGAVQQVSPPLGVRDSKPRGNCRVAGDSPTRSRRFESGMHLGARNRGKFVGLQENSRFQPSPQGRANPPKSTKRR